MNETDNKDVLKLTKRVYTKKEVLEACLEYFEGDELASDVALKYLLRDQNGNFLEKTPKHMHQRLAKEFARIEAKYPNPMDESEIFDLFHKFKFVIPQGSPMSSIGNPYQIQSLSNCFVIESPEDSYGGIFKTDQEQVQIMKRRGGVGFDISNLRPKGCETSNAARTTDGIGIFMERFSNSCREVAQGGRRGALMLSIDCRHPEIETFINIKRDLTKVTGANVSIRFTNEFMEAVDKDSEFTLQWPTNVPLVEAKVTKVVQAKEVWEKFIDSAWTSAEPGALFWDTIIENSIADCYVSQGFETIGVNPCVTGDTIVKTNAGYKTVKELADNNAQFKVKSFDVEKNKVVMKNAIAFKTKDNAEILTLTTKSGKKIRLTKDHRVYTQRGWVEAENLLTSDKILKLA